MSGIARHHWQADVVGAGGFGVTSLVQTVMGCVVRVKLPESVAIVDAALGRRRKEGEGLTRVDVQQAAAGPAQLPNAVGSWKYSNWLTRRQNPSGSPGAEHSSTFWDSCSGPAAFFYDHEGFIARTDFFWPDYGVIGEFDGDAKYLDDELLGGRSTRTLILAEKKREDRLRALGYTVVRWDWKAVTDPDLLRRKLEGAGVAGQKSPPRGLIPPRYRGNGPREGD